MEPFHAVVLTVSLFVLTFNSGANLTCGKTAASTAFAAGVGRPAPRETPLFRAGAFRSGDAHYAMRRYFSYQNCRRRLFIMVRPNSIFATSDAANESTLQTPIAAP